MSQKYAIVYLTPKINDPIYEQGNFIRTLLRHRSELSAAFFSQNAEYHHYFLMLPVSDNGPPPEKVVSKWFYGDYMVLKMVAGCEEEVLMQLKAFQETAPDLPFNILPLDPSCYPFGSID